MSPIQGLYDLGRCFPTADAVGYPVLPCRALGVRGDVDRRLKPPAKPWWSVGAGWIGGLRSGRRQAVGRDDTVVMVSCDNRLLTGAARKEKMARSLTVGVRSEKKWTAQHTLPCWILKRGEPVVLCFRVVVYFIVGMVVEGESDWASAAWAAW